MSTPTELPSTARMETVPELLDGVVKMYLNPPPKPATFRQWLKRGRVPCFKSNPAAERGGGTCWYSVAAVERLLAQRTMKGGR